MSDITRYFTLGGNAAIGVRVTAFIGEGTAKKVQCEFDPQGLVTNLGDAAWTGIDTPEQFHARKDRLVRVLYFELTHAAGQSIVVAQRGKLNRYPASAGSQLGEGEIVEYTFAPCHVTMYRYRDEEREKLNAPGPIAVWTDPMARDHGGCNRIDVWHVDAKGVVTLFCVYIVSVDDGKSFRVVGQKRGGWMVHLRTPGSKHKLRSDDHRVREFYHKNEAARNFLDHYVLVPDELTENFEARMQILADNDFRKFVGELAPPVWNDGDDFWFERPAQQPLGSGQGVVKFLTYGVGRGSFGVAKLQTPVVFDGIEHTSVQFDHRAIVADPSFLDSQGIYFLPSGTVVDVGPCVGMGFKKSTGKRTVKADEEEKTPNPPKALRVTIRSVPGRAQSAAA